MMGLTMAAKDGSSGLLGSSLELEENRTNIQS
jgi:hypothetical protein